MHPHGEHQWSLHDTPAYAEHAREEPGGGAYEGVDDGGARIPLDVTIDVGVAASFLDFVSSYEVGPGEYANEYDPSEHDTVGCPE